MSKQVAQVLKKALAAFGPNGEKWANHLPRGDEQCSVTACSAGARLFSLEYFGAVKALEAAVLLNGFSSLAEWNDAHGRTFADVKTLFENAIQEQERSA